MDSCLSTDLILCRIISKLNLRQKFGAQRVCQRWKDIAIKCLQHQEYLVISGHPMDSFWYFSSCHKNWPGTEYNKDNLLWGKHSDLEFWERTLSLLQQVKYVFMCIRDDDGSKMSFIDYKPILQLLINYCGQSLECFCDPSYYDVEDETFPLTDSLPCLKHMHLPHTTPKVTKAILTACPNLEYLETSTSFTGWQILPKGFKKLQTHSEDFNGIINLFSSPAVQSLEVINSFVMTSEICYQSYHLSCLEKFEVTIDFDVASCLSHLARILSFAPVLRELVIRITAYDEIEPEVWIKVLSQCQTLTHLTVCLFKNPRINMSSWEDHFAEAIVSKVKKLQYLYIDFPLSSYGLRLLSQLDNLQDFRHKIDPQHMSYDNLFDTFIFE